MKMNMALSHFRFQIGLKKSRLVDEKQCAFKRSFCGYDPESKSYAIKRDKGVKETACTFIHTPSHLVGTEYTPDQYGVEQKVVLPLKPFEMR